jgi:hypothetical protein
MKRLLFLTLFLAGCSGMNYAMEHYNEVDPQPITYKDQSFRIFDKPTEGRLMITPTVGNSALQGLTFGGAATAQNTYKQAAAAYLGATGRTCEVTEMMLVVQPQWETFYKCD